MLRVISGKYKGKKLSSPRGRDIRPTPVRLRKRMFDILGYSIIGASFLDGFAGTGSVGIEAYSLGASEVFFIENDPEAIKVLRKNVARIGEPSEIKIVENDFNMGIRELHEKGVLVDFVFIDPPYELLDYANPLKILFKRNILKDEGIIILQKRCDQKIKKPFFEVFREIKEGKNCLVFLRR